MRLENIYTYKNNERKHSITKKSIKKLVQETVEPSQPLDSKYHVGDIVRNKDMGTLWRIHTVFPIWEDYTGPQVYEIATYGKPTMYITATTEDILDREFKIISREETEEPELTGDELNESFLKEEEVEVHPQDQAILDTKFYKVGQHYVFWPTTRRPSHFVLERMFISSSDYRVNCHIVYEDKPGQARVKTSSSVVTDTYVSLKGMEDMRQRGDLQSIEIEEPDTDGSEWDE